jgi:hypothetical protein
MSLISTFDAIEFSSELMDALVVVSSSERPLMFSSQKICWVLLTSSALVALTVKSWRI